MEDLRKTNEVVVSGVVNSKYAYSHEIFGEKFYLFDLVVARSLTLILNLKESLFSVY